MDSNRLNISKIETFFDSLLRGEVTDNLFFAQPPQAIQEAWKEFIVVDCSGMVDWDAYGQGTVLLFVYIPPLGSSGRKDVASFSAIESKINECIETSSDPVYKVRRRETYADYDEDKNMFVDVIEISLVVLT